MSNQYIIFKNKKGFYIQAQANKLEFTNDSLGLPWLFTELGDATSLAKYFSCDLILEIKEVTQDYRIMDIIELTQNTCPTDLKSSILGKFLTLRKLIKIIDDYESI